MSLQTQGLEQPDATSGKAIDNCAVRKEHRTLPKENFEPRVLKTLVRPALVEIAWIACSLEVRDLIL
jgi:hypothetical protein